MKSLSITQDDANLGNQVSGTPGGSSALPVEGPWKTISINQQGGTNKFYGSVKAGGGSTTATLSASYTGGKNTHSLAIGATTAPTNPTVAIAVTNNGGGTNTITDTLDGYRAHLQSGPHRNRQHAHQLCGAPPERSH